MLNYLTARRDLVIKAVAVDATSEQAVKSLLDSIPSPISGCILLPALLNDRIFALHSEDSFNSVFPPKVDAFRVLEKVMDLSSLDFVIPLSSVSGMFGNPGQTNYAAYG